MNIGRWLRSAYKLVNDDIRPKYVGRVPVNWFPPKLLNSRNNPNIFLQGTEYRSANGRTYRLRSGRLLKSGTVPVSPLFLTLLK